MATTKETTSTTTTEKKRGLFSNIAKKNGNAFKTGVKLEAAGTALVAVSSVVAKSGILPKPLVGYLNSPLANIIIANTVAMLGVQLNNPRITAIADVCLDEAYRQAVSSLEIKKFVEDMLDDPKLQGIISSASVNEETETPE
jgi:hypothetical protein